MKVREKMSVNPTTISPDTTVAEAFQLMREKAVRRLPVMKKEKLVGIVTLNELSKVSPSPATSLSIFEINYLLTKARIKDIIPKHMKVITIEANANIEKAAILMRENKIGGIPVMDNGKLVGIITETDIFDAFIDILGVNRPGTRIDLEVDERVGLASQITSVVAQHGMAIENLVLVEKDPQPIFELIIRVASKDTEDLVQDLKNKGFKVLDVITKG
ncbi:MAG TPA: CBS and ACT domain-containing protein [Syntrophomonadaceae bacterium]|nr:CBS and ACT domain-containing protein [Syntrophomonadaceae bacterium]